MSNKNRKLRSALLTGASTAFLAGFGATAAYADPATTTVPSPLTTDIASVAHVSATSGQSIAANVSAEVSDVEGGIDGLVDDGTSAGSTNTVTANTLRANAIGNSYNGAVDLSLVTAAPSDTGPVIDPDAHGAAALSVQLVSGNEVSSVAASNILTIDRPGFETGSATAENNTIEASTTVNRADQTIAGATPSGYVSDAAGRSSLEFPAGNPAFEAQGTVVASTLQQAESAAASATTSGNTVSLDLTADGTNTITSAPVLDNNSIAAGTTVNTARTTIDLQSGSSPAFVGSAVVSNVQSSIAATPTSNTASNQASMILANIEGELVGDGDVNTLDGALSVAGNGITSSVTGNDASGTTAGVDGNRILIGDGLSFSGSGAADPGSDIAYNSGALAQTASADLVINSSQSNVGAGGALNLTAQTELFGVVADVQSVNNGSIAVSGNTASAASTGNRASGAILSGEGAQGFEGSVAVANQQINNNVTQSAVLGDGMIAAVTGTDGGVTQNSSLSVAGNTASASGYGNSASHSIALDANTLDIGNGVVTLSGGTGPDGNVSASGGATLANLQSSYNSSLAVSQSGTQIGLDADSRGPGAGSILSGNSLAATDNTQEAIGLANSATNALSLSSNDVGSGAGIASVQIFDDTSSVSSTIAGSRAGLVASTHVAASQLETSGNLQRALAYGGSVSNTLSVESNAPTLPVSAGVASQIAFDADDDLSFSNDAGALPAVAAAFGILNDQSSQGDLSALASGTAVGITVEGNVSSSTAQNVDNAIVAAAYGNDAANRAALDVGNVSTAGFANVAAVSNTQAAGDATSSITATVTGGDVVLTAIEDDVSGSSVATSDNTLQALAFGNRSTANTLTVTGNNISTAATVSAGVGAVSAGGGDLTLSANASFAVQNAQAAHGVISASQLNDPITPTTAAGVLTTIGTVSDGTGDVANATVVSNGNRSLASVTGNSGASGVSVSGNELATTTGVQNFQTSDATLSALIGLEGEETSTTTPFSYTITGSGLNHDSVSNQLTSGTLRIDTSGLTAAEIAVLISAGWDAGSGEVTRSAAGYGATATEYSALLLGGLSGSDDVTTFGRVPNAGGVRVAVNGDISASTLAVDTNTVAGSVIANNATNALAVNGTSIDSGTGLNQAAALPASVVGAIADHALSNLQSVNGGSLNSDVYATFALDAVEGVDIDNATLSVSGNSQSATAVANTASNALALNANEIAAGSALSSVQGGTVAVSASSDAELFAPAAVNASSVSMRDNANSSLAVVNDVTNSATVSGTSVAALDSDAVANLTGNGFADDVAVGDHVLANAQNAGAEPVSSTAVTRISNEASVDATGLGLRDSSLTFAGNSTGAEASANRASNSLALNGASSQAASAGVANLQTSSAGVTADATSTVAVNLAGGTVFDPQAAVTGSSVTIGGNSTTALARGNAATNALNVEAGAGYVGRDATTIAGSSLDGAGQPSVAAQAAVLNQQGNSGAVGASSTAAGYGAVLNAGAGSAAVVNSTVAIEGNRVASEAYGNTARNTLTLTALNTGVPTSAIGNYQVNSGPISAVTTTVSFGVTSFGGNVGASSLRTTGNQITATAVGNSAVSAIAAK